MQGREDKGGCIAAREDMDNEEGCVLWRSKM